MEQIETQVSDLRYLTSAPTDRGIADLPIQGLPVVASPQSIASDNLNSPAWGHAHSVDGGAATGSGSNKRKADDDGQGGKSGKAQRSKRNRYISIACNECKRRKIKCNGENPCLRCGNLNLLCHYAPNCCSNNFKESDEFRTMTAKVSKLQEQVESLFQNLSALRSESLPPHMPPPQDRLLPLVSPPAAAPTVSPSPVLSHGSSYRPDMAQSKRGASAMISAYSLDAANNVANSSSAATAAVAGYRGFGSVNESASPGGFPDDPHLRHAAPASQDPLWDVPQEEMLRLCRLHEEELGILYPVVDMQMVMSHARSLASFMESSRRNGMLPSLNDERTLLLKVVMCCALAAEDRGHSDRATRLFESMEDEVNRKLMSDAPSVAGLTVLTLVSGYRFLSNDEMLAWRVMGQVARLCLEMGFHRRSGIMAIDSEEERQAALSSFWTAYIFDRRWSFGTGLPFVIQDEESDQLPFPEDHPYLHATISYSRLGARVLQLMTRFSRSPRDLSYIEVEGLDKEIMQWYDSSPEEVKVRDWAKEKRMASTPSYNLQRLQIWTYLRFNQLRIWLYTPFLHSRTSIMSNFHQAKTVVRLATDTLRYLHHLNTTTSLYRKLQVFYHQFLPSAVAVLFLASAHSPSHFAPACRDDFNTALDLLRDLSAKSHVSGRLWRTFSALKAGMPAARENSNSNHGNHGSHGIHSVSHNNGAHLYEDENHHPLAASWSAAAAREAAQHPSRPTTLRSAPVRGARNGQEAAPSQSANGVQLQAEMRRVFEGYVSAGAKGEALPALDSMGRYVDGNVYAHLREMY